MLEDMPMDYAVIAALALAVQVAALVVFLQMPRRQMQPVRVAANRRNR
jgi:hypothetical protein